MVASILVVGFSDDVNRVDVVCCAMSTGIVIVTVVIVVVDTVAGTVVVTFSVVT